MKKLNIILFGIVFLLLSSCENDNIEGELGPNLVNSGLLCPSDDFNYVVPDLPTSLDLANEALTINVPLSETIQWEYGIIGNNGAFFSESMVSDVMSINWQGNTTSDIVFLQDDSVRVYYLINCLDTVFSEQAITLTSERQYDHILISDLDGGDGIGGNWVNVASQLIDLNPTATEGGAAQGMNYLELTSAFQDRGSFLGQAQSRLTGAGLTETPENIYFNAIVRGDGLSTVEFRIIESSGDRYDFQIESLGTDWQAISIPYSDFTEGISVNGQDPTTISEVRIVLRFTDAGEQPIYKADVDFLSFTQGAPLDL